MYLTPLHPVTKWMLNSEEFLRFLLDIFRVQGLPTGYMVPGSDLKNVAGRLPDAEGMY
jgi:hypothetical protein